ncbi:MAG: peptide-methionine (S)-S-oxide reductase [Gammaproteobacteria bacterium]|nr:MAG: peptide-methionine (S)-S-oxide reductase [Gammaproteobacteria bacterium]
MKFSLLILLNLLCTSLITTYAYADDSREAAIFAGGCFWCMEPPFDKLDGVISTTSGYTSGHKDNPTYREVSDGVTGHTEAIQIIYDPKKISYSELLKVFWKNIDPVAVDRQFCDSGTQYRSGIYYLDDEQEKAANQSLQNLQTNKPFEEPIATEVVAASTFYPAEEYHQDYYQKNPLRYKYYRYACGRDQRLETLWGE